MKICLLGAESTGKTTLGQALASHFRAQGRSAAAVDEFLREWCMREARAPRPEELLAIAQEHEARVDAASAHAAIVIADTSALMVAIHGAVLFEDSPLCRFAIERQRGYDMTLVMGLDLPWVADGLQRSRAEDRPEVDALVRGALELAGIPYRVIYGTGPQRLAAALHALAQAPAQEGTQASRPWVWSCDKCSDPACEHRLFTGLLPRGNS